MPIQVRHLKKRPTKRFQKTCSKESNAYTYINVGCCDEKKSSLTAKGCCGSHPENHFEVIAQVCECVNFKPHYLLASELFHNKIITNQSILKARKNLFEYNATRFMLSVPPKSALNSWGEKLGSKLAQNMLSVKMYRRPIHSPRLGYPYCASSIVLVMTHTTTACRRRCGIEQQPLHRRSSEAVYCGMSWWRYCAPAAYSAGGENRFLMKEDFFYLGGADVKIKYVIPGYARRWVYRGTASVRRCARITFLIFISISSFFFLPRFTSLAGWTHAEMVITLNRFRNIIYCTMFYLKNSYTNPVISVLLTMI